MKPPKVTDQDRQIARLLVETFRPRMDVYAERLDDQDQVDRLNRWMEDKCAGSNIAARTWRVNDWKPVGPKDARKPVTLEAIAEHVAGRRTLGFYPLHPDNTCGSVSVDFDNHRGTRVVDRDPRADFDQVTGVLLRRGVRFLANHSRGGHGYWIHVLPPAGTSARVARAVMNAVIKEAGVKHIDEGGTIDSLFPKQDQLYAGGDSTRSPGNLFCLPVSRKWLAADPPGSHFVGTDPRNLGEQLEHLRSYQ